MQPGSTVVKGEGGGGGEGGEALCGVRARQQVMLLQSHARSIADELGVGVGMGGARGGVGVWLWPE